MGSAVLFRDADTYADGTRYEMIATQVPRSDVYPDGVKHRFQYMDETGRTLLRIDNFPHHPDVGRHHYHTPDGVFDDIEFTDLHRHVAAFYRAIDDLRDR